MNKNIIFKIKNFLKNFFPIISIIYRFIYKFFQGHVKIIIPKPICNPLNGTELYILLLQKNPEVKSQAYKQNKKS
jgi:hypothetical protein